MSDMPLVLSPKEFESCRRYWASGLCPCCGSGLNDWDEEPEAVAEGVMMCGRCIKNEHYNPPQFLKMMLEAIATGGS